MRNKLRLLIPVALGLLGWVVSIGWGMLGITAPNLGAALIVLSLLGYIVLWMIAAPALIGKIGFTWLSRRRQWGLGVIVWVVAAATLFALANTGWARTPEQPPVVTEEPYEHQLSQELLELGVILPGNRPFPSDACSDFVPPGAFRVYLGASFVQFFDWLPLSALTVNGVDLLSAAAAGSSGIRINATFYDEDGNIFARMFGDMIRVNEDVYFKEERPLNIRRPDAQTLIVEDSIGKEVLRVVYLNPRTLQITGVLRDSRGVLLRATEDMLQVGGLTFTESCMRGGINFTY